MRIELAEISLVEMRLRTPFTTSFGTYCELSRPFVVLRSSDGLAGVGEMPTLTDPAYKAEVDHFSVVTSLKEFILPAVFRRQLEIGSIGTVDDLRSSYAWIKGAVFAKSGVEAAFWDIEAQRLGQPLWQVWGGSERTFPVGVSIGGRTVEEVLERAEQADGFGYHRFKVKIWPGFDVEVAQALRRRFPDKLLQVDANSAYDLQTWPALTALDNLDLLLIEQPLYDDDIVLHSEISRELKTPVCLDESIHSLRDAQAAMHLWNRNGILDRLIINIKPPRVSGFAEAVDIAAACADQGVRTWIGGMLDSAWGKAMNLQLNGLDSIVLPGDHFSPSGPYFEEDLVAEPLWAPEGSFRLTDGVSACVEFDWKAFERMGERVFEQSANRLS
jgi:o-succinylbenzoate synthase